jgi:hypothetical protein
VRRPHTIPPLAPITWPLIQWPFSQTRNVTTLAMSAGCQDAPARAASLPHQLVWISRAVAIPVSGFDPSGSVITSSPARRNVPAKIWVVVVLPLAPVTKTVPLGIPRARPGTSTGSIRPAR